MKRILFIIAAAFLVAVATASAGTILYDPPAENGTVSYNAPPVDVPYTVDPPQSCNDPAPASATVGTVDVTVDAQQVCVNPPPVNGTVSYDAPAVDVPYTHDPAPRNVTYPDQVAADCADGLDNDGDGQVDMADGGCATADDTLEAPNPACSDGIDNDNDTLVDFPADPGCRDIRDTGEFNSAPPPPAAACADSLDNDGDGKVDMADPGCTDVADNDETDPTQPPPSGNSLILPDNTTFRCSTYPQPVNFDLVKVRITQQTQRQDAAFIDSGCTGHIGRLEIDTWASDGLHIGAGAHDVTVDGGYVVVHGRCGTACDALHGDVIQVLGGKRIHFDNMLVELQYSEGTNSALYINCGNNCQDLPTDVVFDHSTFKRGVDRNRVVRIGYSERSGVRNSTIYYCGTGANCGGGEAIWYGTDPGFTPIDPINENNTLILTGA